MRAWPRRRKRALLFASAAAGVVAAVSCSIITSPSDYVGGVGGGVQVDAGFDANLPDDIVARIFVLGGERDGIADYSNTVTEVWLADMTTDGAVGPWQATTPLIYGGSFSATFSFSKLFAVGRSPTVDNSNRFVVLAAEPGGSGLGQWSGSVADSTISEDYLVPFVWGEFAYAIGGLYYYTDDAGDHTGYENDVQVSRLDPDAAAVLPFTVTQQLNTGRRDAGVLVLDEHLFVIAGRRGSGTYLASVEVAKIDPSDGTLQPFVNLNPVGVLDADGGTDEHQVSFPAVCSHGSHVFVIGGGTPTGPSDQIWYASFDATALDPDAAGGGALSAWTQTTSLPRGLEAASCVVIGDQMLVIGGIGTSSRSDEVMQTTVASDGTVGDWTVSPNVMPFGRSHVAAAPLIP